MSEQEFYDGWFSKALAYCNEKHILPFFAHPQLRIHANGKMSIDDQSHVVICEIRSPQPQAFIQQFAPALEEFEDRTLQDELWMISHMEQRSTCAGLSEICERLRKAAAELGRQLDAERARAEDEAFPWQAEEERLMTGNINAASAL